MHVMDAPTIPDLIAELGPGGVVDAIEAAPDPRAQASYLHWDKLRRLDPPQGLDRKLWWLKIKLSRSDEWRPLPLLNRDGIEFGYTLPDRVLRSLHRIDQRSTATNPGGLAAGRKAGERFVVNSTMEEAIRSSQLEGATTSRAEAKELLETERAPRDRGEQMIANNYAAMQQVREIGPTLTPKHVLALHRTLTTDAIDDPAAAGRLQLPGEERVRVYDRDGGRVVHLPPPAEQLPERLRLMCEFASAPEDSEPFVHPVLRAILLHFWLAYDHPFLDGNGRTARVLFFWAMQARGYRLAEYLPISRLLREGPAEYGRSFLYTETDGGDTTYFILQQLAVLERAIDDFDAYVERKLSEQRDVKQLLHDVDGINGRQLVLLTHALKHPDHGYTFGGHARSNLVTHETARADLGGLAERGFLTRRRQGRAYVFEPAPDLPRRLKESAG